MAPHTFKGDFAGQLLLAEAAPTALRTAQRLVDECPEIAASYAPQAAAKWSAYFEAMLKELAAATAVDTPSLFHNYLAWMTDAFRLRGVPFEHLREALRVLRLSLAATLPEAERATVFDAIDSFVLRPSEEEVSHLSRNDPASQLATRVLVAALEGERMRACELLTEAVRGGLSVRDAHERVICPALREVGRLWHRGELSVAEEHACTAAMQTMLAQLLMIATPAPRNGRTVLTASVEGNSHDIGLRMVADAFELSGYRTVNLGPNVPAEELALAIADFGADAVGLSATLAVQLRPLAEAIEAARATRMSNPVRIIIGGAATGAAPDLWSRLGADAHAPTAWGAVAVADGLLGIVR